MNKFIAVCVAALSTSFLSALAIADAAYPFTNPTYIPTALVAPATYTAPANYVFTTNGIATASLRITGTCTSLAGTLQGTNDSTNWTPLNIHSVGGGSSATSFSAAGFWRANVTGFSKVRVNITALTASCTVAMAGTQSASHASADLCQDAAISKSSAVVNVGASTTAALVAAATGKSVYLCSFVASAAGTNPTMTFKSGTQTTVACDTGVVSLSGAMVPSATTGMVSMGPGSTVLKTSAVSQQLCLTTGATTSIQGVLTYVQQ